MFQNITYQFVQVSTTSIENIIGLKQVNDHDLRLGATYKSLRIHLLSTDLDNLYNTTVNSIITSDLNTKNTV